MNGFYIIIGYNKTILNSKICFCEKKNRNIVLVWFLFVPQYYNKHLMSNSIKRKIKYHSGTDLHAFLPDRYNPKMFVFKKKQKGQYMICGIIMHWFMIFYLQLLFKAPPCRKKTRKFQPLSVHLWSLLHKHLIRQHKRL